MAIRTNAQTNTLHPVVADMAAAWIESDMHRVPVGDDLQDPSADHAGYCIGFDSDEAALLSPINTDAAAALARRMTELCHREGFTDIRWTVAAKVEGEGGASFNRKSGGSVQHYPDRTNAKGEEVKGGVKVAAGIKLSPAKVEGEGEENTPQD